MRDKAVRIVRNAEKLFMSRRYDEVTLDQVASKAGVGKGTIYRYFENKEHLYYQIIMTGLAELVESLERCAQQKQDAGEQLRCLVGRIVEFFTARRSLLRLMHSEQFRGSARRRKMRRAWREKSEEMVDTLASAIGRGMEAGRYRRRVSAKVAARLLLGMVRAALWHRDDMPQDVQVSEVLVDMFEAGICARRGEGE